MLTEVFKGFHYLILTNVMTCLLCGYFIDSGQAAAFGEWEGCPVNIATYGGCNVTLTAYFNVQNNNLMCSAFIDFGVVDGNNNATLKKSVSFGVNGSNDVCEVITVLDNVTPGVREVIFSATRLTNPPDFETLTCEDLLSIKGGSLPFDDEDVVIMTSSVEANMTWSTPSLYTPNDLEGYLVTIQDNQNVTYFKMVTLENTITVTNVTTGSCVQINAIYCGGQYSESILLPLISSGDREIAALENVTANLDCNVLSIEWSAPSASLQDHHVDYYTITVSDFNLTISTKMTNNEVTLDETILSSLYSFEVNVTFTICGWSSKASVTEVDIVPVNFELMNYRILVLNESHGSVLLKPEACNGSYSVSASFECNDGVAPVVNQSSVVNVQNNNDQVTLNYILPLNQTCNGIFTWSRNKKHSTFNIIIETLSPLRFTSQANNAEFGLQYLCLFKCCNVHYGVSQTSEGGCTSLETNFAVLTDDDNACDGYFTLRCDNFTVIDYNQTIPSIASKTIPTTLIHTQTSSFVHVYSSETSATPTSENEEIDGLRSIISLLAATAAVLCVFLAISCLVIILFMFKRRKVYMTADRGDYAIDSISSKAQKPPTIHYERGTSSDHPSVTIKSICASDEPDLYRTVNRTSSINSTNSIPPSALAEDSDSESESDDGTNETNSLLSIGKKYMTANSNTSIKSHQDPTTVSHEHGASSNRLSLRSAIKRIKKSASDSELKLGILRNRTSPSQTPPIPSVNVLRQFTSMVDNDSDSLVSESSTSGLVMATVTSDVVLINNGDDNDTVFTIPQLRKLNTIHEEERKLTESDEVQDYNDNTALTYIMSFNPIDD